MLPQDSSSVAYDLVHRMPATSALPEPQRKQLHSWVACSPAISCSLDPQKGAARADTAQPWPRHEGGTGGAYMLSIISPSRTSRIYL
jgi:hypothetical protein